MKTQPTVVIYDRLSRLFAEEAPDHRINACKAYAAQRGWNVVHVATDTNVSGASRLEDRPGMREVLAWLPRVDYVLAAKLDRYARSVLEFERLLNVAERNHTTVITADGVVSPENASIIIKMLSAFAEYERDMITDRITKSKEYFRARGNHLGGLAPYGYMVVGPVNDKRWAIDETAAAIIRECADQLLNHGATMRGLADDLNKRGILPPAEHARQRDGRTLPSRKDGKPRKAQQWHSTTLRDVLYTAAVRGWLVQSVPGTKRSALTNMPVLDSTGQPLSVAGVLTTGNLHDVSVWVSVALHAVFPLMVWRMHRTPHGHAEPSARPVVTAEPSGSENGPENGAPAVSDEVWQAFDDAAKRPAVPEPVRPDLSAIREAFRSLSADGRVTGKAMAEHFGVSERTGRRYLAMATA